MDPKQLVVVLVALAALLVIAWVFVRKQRTSKLRSRFGPEYDRAVRESGPQRAEAVLLEREKRVQKFRIRELSTEERETFLNQWRTVQSRFVDDPQAAVSDADVLVDRLMQTRGYPMSDFEQQAADISVSHPQVVDNYRAAHLIAVRHQQGQASTEDLRNAIIYYRSLFEELLQAGTTGHKREVA
jgi:FtsZ-interacting cell division protein ZipA